MTEKKQRGLTLIEVLIVITILGLIAGVVSLNVLGFGRTAEIKAAKLDLEGLRTALDVYRMRYHRYPTTAEGLDALIHPPKGGEPLLRRAEVPRDPWDAEYLYELRSDGGQRISLRSKGPDGVAGTSDDIEL